MKVCFLGVQSPYSLAWEEYSLHLLESVAGAFVVCPEEWVHLQLHLRMQPVIKIMSNNVIWYKNGRILPSKYYQRTLHGVKEVVYCMK